MSYFHDQEFQEKLLMFVCRDRNFLKRTADLLSEKDFKPRGKSSENIESFWIAEKAYKYWKDYHDPIGGLLRTEMQDFVSQHKKTIGPKQKDKLFSIVDKIKHANGLVAVEAIEKKVIEYRQRKAKQHAVREMIELQEKGELSDQEFLKICRRALNFHDKTLKIVDYEKDIEQRIKRREANKNRKFPYIFIDAFDKECRTFPRGELGIGLAKYKAGKSTFAVHLGQAYALQGYNVIHFTLEDNVEMVEDRYDASFTGVKIKSLDKHHSTVRKHLKRALEELKGKIRIVDGTDGGMTVERMEEIWENLRNQGFAADVVIVDYDEGVIPPEHHKGEGGERREMQDIYKSLKSFGSRRDIYMWVMAQTKRGKSGVTKQVVTGDDAAMDISKIKRCALCIGIGDGPDKSPEDARFMFVAVHRYDKARFGWPVIGDYARSIFYDRDATETYMTTYVPEKDN